MGEAPSNLIASARHTVKMENNACGAKRPLRAFAPSRDAILLLLALLPATAQADTLIDNVDGITLNAQGHVERFTGLLTDNQGRIQQIFQRGEKRPLRPDFRMDGRGRTLIPGLIDSHVELMKLGFARIPPAAPGARPRPEDRDLALFEAQKLLLERGITAVADMGTTIEDWQTYRRAGDLGSLTLRIMAYAGGTDAMALIGGPGPTPWLYNDHLRLNGVHITLDGSLESRAAALKEPYADAPKSKGMPRLTDIQLRNVMSRAAIDRFQVAIDATGDKAVAMVLDAIDELAPTYKGDRRWRIEMASVIDPADYVRLGKNGVALTVQAAPGQTTELARLGARQSYTGAWKAFAAAGARLTFGSGTEPFAALAAAAARDPDKQVTREIALAAQTSTAAWAGFADGRLGRIAIGQRADFLLIDRDPLMATPEQLRGIRVLQTWVGGRMVYQANDAVEARK
jgi:predicted amidohydrolase YtcJ